MAISFLVIIRTTLHDSLVENLQSSSDPDRSNFYTKLNNEIFSSIASSLTNSMRQKSIGARMCTLEYVRSIASWLPEKIGQKNWDEMGSKAVQPKDDEKLLHTFL